MGATLSRDYAGKNPLFVGILNSAATFLADLVRAVDIPCEYDFVALTPVSPQTGGLFLKDTATSLEGRHVIVVGASTSSARAVEYVARSFAARVPASLAICTLLKHTELCADDVHRAYHALSVESDAVVGYGLDHLGHYRELPDLYALDA